MPAHLRRRATARILSSLAILGTCLLAGGPADRMAWAQLPQARLFAVHPSGAQRGTTVELTLAGGTDLEEASQLYFSHPGITAAPKTQMVDGRPQPVAGQFTVTVAADVPVGVYDIRARGLFGLSNPRTFTVSDRKEVIEVEPNNAPEQAAAVELNSIVNGRADGGADIDWYKLSLKAGQRVIAALRSKRIDSRMEGVLDLYQNGRRIAHRVMQYRAEPLLDFTAPADGDYLLKVHDFVYGGSAEYFYRLTVHTGPHIEFVLPASGLPGTTGEYTIFGRNLPGSQPSEMKAADGKPLEQLKLQIAAVAEPSTLVPGEQFSPEEAGTDGIPFALNLPNGTSDPVTLYFASAATAAEREPNDTSANAQKLNVPVEVTGQFQARGDIDHFQFDAKSGEVFWIEVFGQRSGTSADPVLVIDQVKKDDKGEETVTRITAVDDNPANIGGLLFNTVTDDPVFRLAVPADGLYRVTVRDRSFENRGSPSLVYRLSIRREAPDFRLVALPAFPSADPNQQQNTWDLGLRRGDNALLTVMAFRRDGFAGSIDVRVEGLPPGVTCPGATIGPNQTQAQLVLTSSETAPAWHGAIHVTGRARIDDPAAAAAETAAIAARTTAANAIAALDKAVADTAAAHKAAGEKAAAAKTALDNDQNNEGLKKAKADADTMLAAADAASKAAVAAKAAGEAKVNETNAAVVAARGTRNLAARELVRTARSGTIVWSGNPAAQLAAQSRMARSITLSVLKEAAPYQLVTDLNRVTVNQGSQILVPFRVLKRAGFDENVNLTFVAPPQNLQVENKPVNKGTSEQAHRVYVQNNAPLGTFTLFVQSQAQVSYSRNPEAAALAAKEKEATDKLAAEAAETAKKAAEAKTVADKKVTDTAAEAKKAAEGKVAADKLATDTAAAAKTAADEKVKADKAAADAEAAAKAAVDAAAKAKEALDKDANNEDLKKAKADADALVTKTTDEAKKTAEAKAAADKKAADTAEAAKKAAEAKATADKAATDADVAAKKAVEEKAAADKLAAETDQQSKTAAAAKAAADKKATDTANVAKPANVNVTAPGAAIVVEIRPAPGTLAVNIPNNGALKRGTSVEVKVVVTRTNGFSGPVTLSLPLPPGVAGLTAAPVTIPADRNEGVLVIQASGEATMGQLANLVVRASMEFDGPAAIDQPVAINVQQ